MSEVKTDKESKDGKKHRRKAHKELQGKTWKIETGCGSMYVIVNEVEGEVVQILLRLGKSGVCPAAGLDVTSRFINLILKDSDVELEEMVKILRGTRCNSPAFDA